MRVPGGAGDEHELQLVGFMLCTRGPFCSGKYTRCVVESTATCASGARRSRQSFFTPFPALGVHRDDRPQRRRRPGGATRRRRARRDLGRTSCSHDLPFVEVEGQQPRIAVARDEREPSWRVDEQPMIVVAARQRDAANDAVRARADRRDLVAGAGRPRARGPTRQKVTEDRIRCKAGQD